MIGDSEAEVLLVQPQRDKAAALRLLRTLLRRQGFIPMVIVTDKLRSYGAALREIGYSGLHEQRLRANNRTVERCDSCGLIIEASEVKSLVASLLTCQSPWALTRLVETDHARSA